MSVTVAKSGAKAHELCRSVSPNGQNERTETWKDYILMIVFKFLLGKTNILADVSTISFVRKSNFCRKFVINLFEN